MRIKKEPLSSGSFFIHSPKTGGFVSLSEGLF